MITICLSLSAQVAKSTFFVKSPVLAYIQFDSWASILYCYLLSHRFLSNVLHVSLMFIKGDSGVFFNNLLMICQGLSFKNDYHSLYIAKCKIIFKLLNKEYI